jgi:hypothetical protein
MLSKYAKGVVAFIGAFATTLSVAVSDAASQGDSWITATVAAAITALTAAGVIGTKNTDSEV